MLFWGHYIKNSKATTVNTVSLVLKWGGSGNSLRWCISDYLEHGIQLFQFFLIERWSLCSYGAHCSSSHAVLQTLESVEVIISTTSTLWNVVGGVGGVGVHLKVALSVLMLCTPVFIFTSGSSALLGRWFIALTVATCHIQSTFLSWCQFIFHQKTDKTRKYSKSAIFVW